MAKRTPPTPTPTNEPTNGKKTKSCAITRKDFLELAEPIAINILSGENHSSNLIIDDIREFSTGSFGFYCNGKFTVMVGDKKITCQLNGSLIVVGSKDQTE